MSTNIDTAQTQLYMLQQIQSDLNPGDPMRFSERHFSHAKYFLSILPEIPNIYPNPGKSLLFSYGNSDDFLEFELFEDGSIGMFYKTSKDDYKYQRSSIYKISSFFKYFFPEEMKNESSAG